ncbi:MAG: DEAD/DEAH box helicase [Anaerolineae bacterium]|nr:DEAD/DEAH box helicase [Anaerolineae bacterium]
MMKLEDLKRGAQVKGIDPHQPVTAIDIQWHGANAVELFYKRADGHPGTQLLYRDSEAVLEIVQAGRAWSFDGDGSLLRLTSEAYRIHLAHLFDPVLAVHTSLIEPLPHQITAVYSEMLTRQPLRFLLADDPGAGKTVMAGLLIKELVVRGDVQRCLICVPGGLGEQWQDELWFKFQLPFEIMTRETVEASRSGNPFTEHDLVIIRLDQISRSDDLQAKLKVTDWDMIICDEAHKLSASFFGGELKETKRYKLGRLLSSLTRHFLLMTATPHNGKEEDFQLFLALLDADRFEGRFRDGVHTVDVSDLMRRMVKEDLLKFDGKPLFPERRARTVDYALSDAEAQLYHAVTEYVCEQFNRADQLDNIGRKGTVGFALTILQRRLASSPEAIYQSLRRRRERLEDRLQEEKMLKRGADLSADAGFPLFSDEDLDDLDDAPDSEVEEIEEAVIDRATAARTIAELEIEIEHLRDLEAMASRVRHSGLDRKWEELASLMQTHEEMADSDRGRSKLVIFTEHRDTLNYLYDRISTLLGRKEYVVCIHGGMAREERRGIEEQFRSDPDVIVLLATDAAGEGINLQRAHLMVNYDLPWNPNRLEQRFGRIHRIGQTEVCHLWNLVAGETREGYVYRRLLDKLEIERQALNGQVFDVLGHPSGQEPLRKLLVEAIRYGERPDVRARLEQAVDNALDRERVRDLLDTRSLAAESMDITHIMRIREDMERAAARRLQPFYIQSFFLEAFQHLGGTIREREPGRYQITHVPAAIRSRDRLIGTGAPVLKQYERVCFDKPLISVPGKPLAAFVCPGHPLLDATLDLVLERHRDTLKCGAVLVDPTDPGTEVRALFYLQQSIHDARTIRGGEQHLISQEVHFVEIDAQGHVRHAGSAPYLDYRPATEEEISQAQAALNADWLTAEHLEAAASSYAIEELIPRHLARVRQRREDLIDKTVAAVRERLTKEINYWDFRANELRAQEQAGRPNAKINSARARQRADELEGRLRRRLEELDQERQISAPPPVIIGGALIVPAGLLWGEDVPAAVRDRRITEQIAMQAVLETEIRLGHSPRDVSADNLGYDIESRDGQTGQLRFIEVKGRRAGAETVTVTYNEIRALCNRPDTGILALVEVDDNGRAHPPRYVWHAFDREPHFSVASVNYNMDELLVMSEDPT